MLSSTRFCFLLFFLKSSLLVEFQFLSCDSTSLVHFLLTPLVCVFFMEWSAAEIVWLHQNPPSLFFFFFCDNLKRTEHSREKWRTETRRNKRKKWTAVERDSSRRRASSSSLITTIRQKKRKKKSNKRKINNEEEKDGDLTWIRPFRYYIIPFDLFRHFLSCVCGQTQRKMRTHLILFVWQVGTVEERKSEESVHGRKKKSAWLDFFWVVVKNGALLPTESKKKEKKKATH